MKRFTIHFLVFALALPLASVAYAQGHEHGSKASAPAAQHPDSVTHSNVTINGRVIHYTATAGTIVLRNAKGQPTASMFYIAYTKDGEHARTRPVTFAWNGGPGGSSVLVNLGGFGPMRVETANAKPTPPAPYTLEKNPYSLLDKTDLVFVDAVGTGYSRLMGKSKPKDFYGADQDVRAFGDFIEGYLQKYDRWNSPKFILGESYGTPRCAMLSDWLQNNGVALNGVILLSSALNFNDMTWFQPPGSNDLTYELYLPSYAAIAWYHDKLPNKPANLPEFVQKVREFALGQYAQALMAGDSISAAQENAVVAKLHEYTGLSDKYLKETRLRIRPARFMKQLLRGQARTIGRYDARYEGIDYDSAGEYPGYDASGTAIFPAVVSAFHNYLLNDLKYKSDAKYIFLSYKVNRAWDWHHRIDGHEYPVPDTLPDLRQAMSENPHLMVFSGNGYFDLATPFFKTQYELNHMGLAPSLQKNISIHFYHDGHMLYIRTSALKKLQKNLDTFYDSALKN